MVWVHFTPQHNCPVWRSRQQGGKKVMRQWPWQQNCIICWLLAAVDVAVVVVAGGGGEHTTATVSHFTTAWSYLWKNKLLGNQLFFCSKTAVMVVDSLRQQEDRQRWVALAITKRWKLSFSEKKSKLIIFWRWRDIKTREQERERKNEREREREEREGRSERGVSAKKWKKQQQLN